MAPVQLNKLANVAEETSCQGKNVSSRINKENLSLEQAIELSYLSMKMRRWKINLTLNQTIIKKKKKMENLRKVVEDNFWLTNDLLSKVD